jgi:hypothetical protein
VISLKEQLTAANELHMTRLRVTELESQLRVSKDANTLLAHREAELGAEVATLRESLSAFWATWADALWHSDDPARPAQPADCSTREALQLLLDRHVELMQAGHEEMLRLQERHERERAEVASELHTIEDGLSRLQAEHAR